MYLSQTKQLMRIYRAQEHMICRILKVDDNRKCGNFKEGQLIWQVIKFILKFYSFKNHAHFFIYRTFDNKYKVTDSRARIISTENRNR